MRVLQVGKYFPPVPGGIETFTADLHRALPRVGADGHVLAHRPRGADEADEAEVTLVPTVGEWLFTPVAPGFRGHLERLIRGFRPDLLHLHMPNPSAFWALTSAAARRVPWVVQWHSDVLAGPGQWGLRLGYPFYAPWQRALLGRCARILVSSQAYLDASAPLGAHRERCRVLPLGLDPARLQETDERSPALWRPELYRILGIGRLTHYKGFEVLIEALAGIDRAQLILVGSGTGEERLRAACRRFGVANRVEFRTAATDPERNALLASCDCLCLPSIERTEAFGLVLVEAMALAKPVVASELAGSGVPEVVRRGGHGLLADTGSAVALRGQLARLAADPALAAELGARGRYRFEREFHIDLTAARLAEIYAEVVAEAAARPSR